MDKGTDAYSFVLYGMSREQKRSFINHIFLNAAELSTLNPVLGTGNLRNQLNWPDNVFFVRRNSNKQRHIASWPQVITTQT